MKKLIYLSLCFVFSLSMFSCNTSQKTAGNDDSEVVYSNNKKKKKQEKPKIFYTSLAHYLREKGGVQVTGAGEESTRLKLRGMNSIKGDTRPFIYIDKIPMGRSYKVINNAVDPNDIIGVRILSSLSETAMYGEDGHSGIILIKTRTGSTKKKKN